MTSKNPPTWRQIAVLVALRAAGRTAVALAGALAGALGEPARSPPVGALLASMVELGLISSHTGGRMQPTFHLTSAGVAELERQGLSVSDPLLARK